MFFSFFVEKRMGSDIRHESDCTGMNNKGFSLIELALAMIVIGVLATPFLQEYNLYSKRRISDQTQVSMGVAGIVPQAMADFVNANDRYPCPADLSLAEDDPNHGQENCPPAGAPAPGTCTAGGGICRTTGRDADGIGGPDPVLIGGVPYATLNIPASASLDGWKRKITYVVSERMADGSVAPFDNTQGVIDIREQDGDDLSPTLVPGFGSQTYLLVSHGENGVGAFTTSGKLVAPCPANGANGRDWENCDNDSRFETPGMSNAAVPQGLRSLREGPGYNDDEILYSVFGLKGLWSYSANPDNIHNENTGYVGINQPDPTEQLDVIGNIKAETVHAQSYCDDAGNCFQPGIIGGAGVTCGSEAMTGLANSNSICDLHLPANAISGSCPSGEYAIGIIGGVIQCAPPPPPP